MWKHSYIRLKGVYSSSNCFEQAVTVVANAEELIPLQDLAQHNIACLSMISDHTAQQARKSHVYHASMWKNAYIPTE